MVITIEGYNMKKNSCTSVAAIIGGMLAAKRSQKTLILQLIGHDIVTCEKILANIGNDAQTRDQSIDGLLSEGDSKKLTKDHFDQYVHHIADKDNLLDVSGITQNKNFLIQYPNRLDTILKVVRNARDIYENVVLLLPTPIGEKNKNDIDEVAETNKLIKTHKDTFNVIDEKTGQEKKTERTLVDCSIYCIHQGYSKNYRWEVTGNKILYLITNYDEESYFQENFMERMFDLKKGMLAASFGKPAKPEYMYKLSRNIGASDANLKGELFEFIKRNRELEDFDPNYMWIYDVLNIIMFATGEKKIVTDLSWESNEKIKWENRPLNTMENPEHYSNAFQKDLDNMIYEDTEKMKNKKKKLFSFFDKSGEKTGNKEVDSILEDSEENTVQAEEPVEETENPGFPSNLIAQKIEEIQENDNKEDEMKYNKPLEVLMFGETGNDYDTVPTDEEREDLTLEEFLGLSNNELANEIAEIQDQSAATDSFSDNVEQTDNTFEEENTLDEDTGWIEVDEPEIVEDDIVHETVDAEPTTNSEADAVIDDEVFEDDSDTQSEDTIVFNEEHAEEDIPDPDNPSIWDNLRASAEDMSEEDFQNFVKGEFLSEKADETDVPDTESEVPNTESEEDIVYVTKKKKTRKTIGVRR